MAGERSFCTRRLLPPPCSSGCCRAAAAWLVGDGSRGTPGCRRLCPEEQLIQWVVWLKQQPWSNSAPCFTGRRGWDHSMVRWIRAGLYPGPSLPSPRVV